jgi:spore germination cell wall hydrolase CwlJ-like protein
MNKLREIILTLSDAEVLALNAFFEARGEWRRIGDIAYIAVSAVVMNRVCHPVKFQRTVQKVVASPWQFSWTNETDSQYGMALSMAQDPGYGWGEAWQAAQEIAMAVLEGEVENPVENSTYYFAYKYCNPPWAASMREVKIIGNHKFLAAWDDPTELWVPGL